MIVKILGTGCSKCNTLEENVRQAVERLGINTSIEKISEITEIMKYGVLSTPALVIDEQVVFSGQVPSIGEIEKFFQEK